MNKEKIELKLRLAKENEARTLNILEEIRKEINYLDKSLKSKKELEGKTYFRNDTDL